MGLRASGGRLAIRLSFGTVAIACVNCCVMIGKVYAALIYIYIYIYIYIDFVVCVFCGIFSGGRGMLEDILQKQWSFFSEKNVVVV